MRLDLETETETSLLWKRPIRPTQFALDGRSGNPLGIRRRSE